MISIKKQFKVLHGLLLEEKPQLADVIVWLQGDRYDRATKVFKLYREGWAKKIIISGNNILLGVKVRPGENNISLDSMKQFLLKKGVALKDLIIDDASMNTKEQAVRILKLAKAKKWSKLILVGSSYYQPRALLTFLKQAENIGWEGEIINQARIIAWNKIPAGRNMTAKFLFNQEFKKVEKYKDDLAPIELGITYLNKRSINLRRVTKKDIKLLFDWANDPEVRSNAKTKKSITWPEHISWFNGMLSNKSIFTFILSDSHTDIGVVRFNKNNNYYVITYSIDKRYRGRGFGTLILKKGVDALNNINNSAKYLAYVKSNNIVSEKIFNKLRFIFKGEKVLDSIKYKIFQKNFKNKI